jgi:hypothetical protein
LESYHPYLQPPKVPKNPQTYCVHKTLPKVQKAHFGFLGTLGIKAHCNLPQSSPS